MKFLISGTVDTSSAVADIPGCYKALDTKINNILTSKKNMSFDVAVVNFNFFDFVKSQSNDNTDSSSSSIAASSSSSAQEIDMNESTASSLLQKAERMSLSVPFFCIDGKSDESLNKDSKVIIDRYGKYISLYRIMDASSSVANEAEGMEEERSKKYLTIVYVNEKANESTTKDDVDSMQKIFKNIRESQKVVDILVTYYWPKGIESCAADEDKPLLSSLKLDKMGNEIAALAAKEICPRYHFSLAHDVFFQAIPYSNPALSNSTTRFISLAHIKKSEDATKDKKWLHALSLTPGDLQLNATITNQVENPYLKLAEPLMQASSSSLNADDINLQKRYRGDNDELERPGSSFKRQQNSRLDNKTINKLMEEGKSQEKYLHNNRYGHLEKGSKFNQTAGKQKTRIPPRMDCWFCVASPNCEKHLIVQVGEETYVALPKGGMSQFHALIVPVSHEKCISDMPREALEEIASTIKSISKYFVANRFFPLIYERNVELDKAAQRHAFLEIVPIPMLFLPRLEDIIHTETRKLGLHFEELYQCPDENPQAVLEGLFALQNRVRNPMEVGTDASGQVSPGSSKEYMFMLLPTTDNKILFLEINDSNRFRSSTQIDSSSSESHGKLSKVPNEFEDDEEGPSLFHRPGGKGKHFSRSSASGPKRRNIIPLQLARMIACQIMNCVEKSNWKNCVVSKEEETIMAQKFRKGMQGN